MGVPSFYRWLLNKYPKIVSDAVEGNTEANPNEMEFDNFYLDMNGIIHPCFHPEDKAFPPTTFDEVFTSIYEYIDRLFNIVRPRKLLFMAIDGVAPRAKMNQQRARRFRTAKDAQTADEMEEKLRRQFEKEGKSLLKKEESEVSDSNVISPGTEFMHDLSNKLQSYIKQRMSENPAWRDIKVILSDDNVPGEGEHKVMSFIRAQRATPGYDPNTRHCLYGLDADLIMLALATHEIHFSILREEVLSPATQHCNETALESSIAQCMKSRGRFKEKSESAVESEKSVKKKQHYQFLNVWLLREYLALDLEIPSSDKFEYDVERIIDDFIFICFFAGNDFLPHIPTLEIHERCLDLLMHVYKEELQNLGGYLVDSQKVQDRKGAYIKLKRVERFILTVGAYEEKIFSKRAYIRERNLRRILSEYRDAKEDEKNFLDEGTSSEIVASNVALDVNKELKISASASDFDTVLSNTRDLKQQLKDCIRKQSDLFKDGCLGTDKVKFGKDGWRERYYKEKFSAESSDEIEATRKDVVAKYGEGLCWVLLYYFSGVPSWTWYYPYHYGPLASDLKGLSQAKMKFQKGLPFKPFDQLMGVLPPRSACALPASYKGLMTDANSKIIDFYPTEFQTDVDGKRFLWQGICKLPFIEDERLLTETKKLGNELKDHEKMRNLQSLDRLFVRRSSKERPEVSSHGSGAASKQIEGAVMMDCTIEAIKGTVHLMPDDIIQADGDNRDEYAKNVSCMLYEICHGLQHIPRPLEGVKIPEKMICEEDIGETFLWHEHHGRSSSSTANANRFQNQRRLIKSDNKSEPTPQNHPLAIAHKFEGLGFTPSRGKPTYSVGNQPPIGEIKPGTSTGYGVWGRGRGRGNQQSAVGRTEHSGRSRGGGSFRGYAHGSVGRSGPNQRPTANHRPDQVGSNFWQSRGGATYDPRDDWRSDIPNTSRGRGRAW